MTDTFDFQEALSYIKAGMVVSLTINNTERRYWLNQFGDIMCTPKGKEHLSYKVQKFHIDSIMSNDWKLINNE